MNNWTRSKGRSPIKRNFPIWQRFPVASGRTGTRNGGAGQHTATMIRRVGAACAAIVAAMALTIAARADIRFQNVTAGSGLDTADRSYGAAWGDFNGDGWPDLLIGRHEAMMRLYLNHGDGTFSESMLDVWPGAVSGRDAHGAAWGDFDNDGDQDVFVLTGAANGTGAHDNFLLVNYSGTFIDEARLRGLAYPLGRGRNPLWVDWNQDGLLDAFEPTEVRAGVASELFLQGPTSFAPSGLSSLMAGQTNHFAQLRDVTGDHKPELIIHRTGGYPALVLALGTNPPQNLAAALGIPVTNPVYDAVIEDLDGDLDNDMFLLRTSHNASEALQTGNAVVKAFFTLNVAEKGIDFTTAGNLTIEADPSWYVSPGEIYVGASGRHPAGLKFNVTRADAGLAPHTPGVNFGVYIGYDAAAGVWRLRTTSADYRTQEYRITSTSPISGLLSVGFTPGLFYEPERLLIRTATGFVDRTVAAGFGFPTGCETGVAGDFDNDTDLDLYLVCRSQVDNPPDLLYENLGNGTFNDVPDAGGAAGGREGRGNTVNVVDFDRDGFLDLFVTNGWGAPLLAADGRYELFRNQGNDNHWIALELSGTQSNRDAIGAKVLLTAGGKTQMRENGGGTHTRGQNDALIHFGLGNSDVVDELTIHWPSGQAQTVSNLAADVIHLIEEPVDNGGGPDPDGAPVYSGSVDKGIFLWRENGNSWRLRVAGGGQSATYTGRLAADRPFVTVTPWGYEANDVLDRPNPATVDFRMGLSNGYRDGLDFVIAAGANVCVDLALPAGATVWIGASRVAVTPPFNLANFGACA